MNRRDTGLALLALAVSPLFASAQQPSKVWRIGLLTASSRTTNEALLQDFKQALRALGYVEGQNYVLEPRFANGDLNRLAILASELVRLEADVIISVATRPAMEIIKVTTVIPVVLHSAGDPVGAGLVKTLGRPGGNVTGTSNSLTDIAPKHLDLLRDLLPKLSRLAVLMNPAYKSHRDALATIRSLASGIGVEILQVGAGSSAEIESGFAKMAKQRVDAFIVVLDPIFDEQRQQIGDLAIKGRLPGVGYADRYAYSGCLMSYGAVRSEISRRAMVYVDKILKGAKPGDLPVEQPTKFELVINMKTAKALGIMIPQSILLRADRVIE